MRDFDDSTLWRISAYERMRAETGQSGFAGLRRTTVLPTTLNAELSHLRRAGHTDDVLEVVAACMRQRESALILLQHGGLIWPLTLFPQHEVYHSPRPLARALTGGSRDLSVAAVEPPGLRAPADRARERVGDLHHYHPLAPLLWTLALHAPRAHVLEPIAGRAAYRLAPDFTADVSTLTGALGAALQRLRTEIASLHDIAQWPGMDAERAARLLNGTYLQGGLMVLRRHPAARDSAATGRRLRDWWRKSGL